MHSKAKRATIPSPDLVAHLAATTQADIADPETGHGMEDDILWAFVERVAYEDSRAHADAVALMHWNEENAGRARWYA